MLRKTMEARVRPRGRAMLASRIPPLLASRILQVDLLLTAKKARMWIPLRGRTVLRTGQLRTVLSRVRLTNRTAPAVPTIRTDRAVRLPPTAQTAETPLTVRVRLPVRGNQMRTPEAALALRQGVRGRWIARMHRAYRAYRARRMRQSKGRIPLRHVQPAQRALGSASCHNWPLRLSRGSDVRVDS